MVKDIASGSGSANPSALGVSAGRLFFTADDGVHGQELWLHTGENRVIDYSYDGLSRLTSALQTPGQVYTYTYDLAGNRTDVWQNGALAQHQTYDAANQVSGWTYDAAGNLINDGTTTFSYDALNRQTGRGATTYSYNGDGVLVYDGTTRYTQDLAGPLSQVLQTTQGVTSTHYLYGQERLASVLSGTRTWYVTDALGSVRQTLNNSGAVLGTVNYDPWGTVESGSVPTFGFTGELQDSATGLVNLRARWYSTLNGTFTSRDPFEGNPERPYSLHPYQYGYSDPVLQTDPTGMVVSDGDGGGVGSKACGIINWVWQMDSRRCVSPYQITRTKISEIKHQATLAQQFARPCLP